MSVHPRKRPWLSFCLQCRCKMFLINYENPRQEIRCPETVSAMTRVNPPQIRSLVFLAKSNLFEGLFSKYLLDQVFSSYFCFLICLGKNFSHRVKQSTNEQKGILSSVTLLVTQSTSLFQIKHCLSTVESQKAGFGENINCVFFFSKCKNQ